MKALLKIICISLVLFCPFRSVVGQTFPCNGSLLLSINQGAAPNRTNKISFGPFGTVFYSPLINIPNGHFNSLGYNPLDNYIYGVEVNTNNIVRIKADGSFERIGSFDAKSIITSHAGDCTADGLYVCHDRELDELLYFDVVDGFRLVDRFPLYFEGSGDPYTARLDDIAVDPNNPSFAYSFQGDYFDPDLDPFGFRGYVLRIVIDRTSPNVGMVTPLARAPEDVIRKIGSLFFTNDGGLFGYGSLEQDSRPRQGRFVSINTVTGATRFVDQTGPTASSTDGCSCAYSLTFENNAEPRGLLCSDVSTTYNLNINNRFFQEIEDVLLTDTFPEGMIIESVSGSYEGTIDPSTGPGTRYLSIDGLSIPARGVVNINIKVQVLDLGLQLNGNQAHLKNLPERYGGSMVSDDPQTIGFLGDVTDVYIIAQDLEEFTIDIEHPSNCEQADDAKIRVAAPVLVVGEEYQVKMQNEEFEEFERTVIIDEEHSFRLDGLLPGEYDLYELNTESSECSFALNDTTINVIPPHDDLQVTASTNSPLCENEDLEFSASMSPLGEVTWSGVRFKTTGLNAALPTVIPAQSGIYEMKATYGYCEQYRELDVVITEKIKAAIEGEQVYCERDTIKLEASGRGDLQSFVWRGPDDNSMSGEALALADATQAQSGEYELIIDNGACTDTAIMEVNILPAPTINIDESIRTDFCARLVLRPEVSSAEGVSYDWYPSESLSCIDCLTPEVTFPIQPSYDLLVTADNGCADSARVNVTLAKENLIYVPNIFSPNAASANNDFTLAPGCSVNKVLKHKVFNRWGKVVHEEGPFSPIAQDVYWDGLIKGRTADAGVYVWYLELELADGQVQELYGDVTLIP